MYITGTISIENIVKKFKTIHEKYVENFNEEWEDTDKGICNNLNVPFERPTIFDDEARYFIRATKMKPTKFHNSNWLDSLYRLKGGVFEYFSTFEGWVVSDIPVSKINTIPFVEILK